MDENTKKWAQGTTLIEIFDLDPICAVPLCLEIPIALMHWVVHRLNQEVGESGRVEFFVSKVEYHGAYPSIVAGSYDYPADIRERSSHFVQQLLRESPILEFVQFLDSQKKDWTAITQEIME
jgi:hypothetical protein